MWSTKANSLSAIATCIAFSCEDWSCDIHLAFIYAIVFGEEGLTILQSQYNIDDNTINNLKFLHKDFKMRMDIKTMRMFEQKDNGHHAP